MANPITAVEATRTLSARALSNEISRRKKPRDERGSASSWVFSGMLTAQIEAVLNGEVVRVEFKSGNVEHVGLRN